MRLKKCLITILICLLGCMLLVAGCGKNNSNKELKSKTVTVTDCTGRSVELPQPIEKVVILNSDAGEALRILKVHDTVVGAPDNVQSHDYLGMEKVESIGKWNQPSYEKIVELKPQVVLSYGSSTPGPEVADKLEPAGIKVVFLDFYKPEIFDTDLKTLAKMFGKEKEASAFLKWKADQIALLGKTKGIKKEQRCKVLTMSTSKLEQEKWSTYGSGTATHEAVEMAGGINVAQELKDYPDISPEWILQQNPGVLVFPDYKNFLGYKAIDFGDAEKFKEKVAANKVFSKTDAVQKDRSYILSSRILGGNKTYLGALYLAKWFYPDQFTSLDPDKVLKEYFEKWLDIPFQGKWAYPAPK